MKSRIIKQEDNSQNSGLKSVASPIKEHNITKNPETTNVNVDGQGNDINQNHNHNTKKECLGPNTKR